MSKPGFGDMVILTNEAQKRYPKCGVAVVVQTEGRPEHIRVWFEGGTFSTWWYEGDWEVVPLDDHKEFCRLGGRRGGVARAAKLSPERRSEIAKLGAATRWKKAAVTPANEGGDV